MQVQSNMRNFTGTHHLKKFENHWSKQLSDCRLQLSDFLLIVVSSESEMRTIQWSLFSVFWIKFVCVKSRLITQTSVESLQVYAAVNKSRIWPSMFQDYPFKRRASTMVFNWGQKGLHRMFIYYVPFQVYFFIQSQMSLLVHEEYVTCIIVLKAINFSLGWWSLSNGNWWPHWSFERD